MINKKKIQNQNEILLQEENVFKSIRINHPIFIDDGKIKLKVLKVSKNIIETKGYFRRSIKSKKGINLPETVLKNSALTLQIKKMSKKVLELGVDWIALSFIQSPEDIKGFKKICKKNVSIMAKIEKPTALNHINKITELADGLMIARGDLGVELPIQDVPSWQKRLLEKQECKESQLLYQHKCLSP